MEKITFGDGLPGYVVGDKNAPGVLVIQEWWGITDIIKEQAKQISEKGYRCLVPDLYKGKVGVDAEEASHLMNNLDFKAAIGELTQAVNYLKESGSKKVGVVGFCMGGALAFCAAEHSGVDCAAPFYGTPDPRVCTVTNIKVPVSAHFGLEDAMKGFSDPEKADAVIKEMKDAGCSVEYHTYAGAGHGFFNAIVGPQGVEKLKAINAVAPPEAAVEKAKSNLFEFLGKHLQG